MPEPLTMIAVGSTLVSAYGQYKSGQAQAAATEQQAQINLLKAEEIISRNEINNELLMESALVHQGKQTAQLAGAGRTIESGRGLLRDTMTKASEQIERNTRAAEWDARMTRLGAESMLTSADQIETASTISSVATAGFGIGSAFHNSPGGNSKSTNKKG